MLFTGSIGTRRFIFMVTGKYVFFCLTSKMSHGHSGRGSCLVRKLGPKLHFEKGHDSTRHDRCGRWLWRLVGLFSQQQDMTAKSTKAANAEFVTTRSSRTALPVELPKPIVAELLQSFRRHLPRRNRTSCPLRSSYFLPQDLIVTLHASNDACAFQELNLRGSTRRSGIKPSLTKRERIPPSVLA